MNPGVIILGIGALAAWFAIAKKNAIPLLNYYLSGLGIDFDGVTPILNVRLNIQNVTNEQFNINSIVANVYADGVQIGNLSTFIPVTIRPNSQITLPVNIRLQLLAIVSDLVDLIQKKTGIPKTLSIKGYVNASGVVVPMEINYTIKF